MLDKLLTQYDRKDGFKTDSAEQIGNAGLYFFRRAFGRKVAVLSNSEYPFKRTSTQKTIAIAIIIFTAPIMIPAILIGFVAAYLSDTHGKNLPIPKKLFDTAEKSFSPEKPKSPIAQSPDTPASPETPISPVNTNKFVFGDVTLTAEIVEHINNGHRDMQACGLTTIDQIRAYVKIYKNEMLTLKLSNLDLTQDAKIFNENVFQEIELDGCKVSQNVLSQLNVEKKLNTLKLTNGTLYPNALQHVKLDRISNLDLSGNNLIDDDFKSFSENELWLKNLDISRNHLTDGVFEHLRALRMPSSFNISSNQITDAGLVKAFKIIANLRQGYKVNFSNNKITEVGIVELRKQISIREILKLEIENEALDKKKIHNLLIKLVDNYSDKGALLELGYTPKELNITDSEQLYKSIMYCNEELTEFDASDIDLAKGNHVFLKHIFKTDVFSKLTCLNLSRCNLNSDDLKIIIQNCPTLNSLNLSGNPALTYEAVEACFGGKIPHFVTGYVTKLDKVAVEKSYNEKLGLLKNEIIKKIIGSEKWLLNLNKELIEAYINRDVHSRYRSSIPRESELNDLVFNLSKRFSFKLSEDQKASLITIVKESSLDKNTIYNTLCSFAKVKNIEEYLSLGINGKYIAGYRVDAFKAYPLLEEAQKSFDDLNISILKFDILDDVIDLAKYSTALNEQIERVENLLLKALVESRNYFMAYNLSLLRPDSSDQDRIILRDSGSYINIISYNYQYEKLDSTQFRTDLNKVFTNYTVALEDVKALLANKGNRILPTVSENEILNYGKSS